MNMFKTVMKKMKMKQASMAHSLLQTLGDARFSGTTPSIYNFLHTSGVSTTHLTCLDPPMLIKPFVKYKRQYHAAFLKYIALWDALNKRSTKLLML